MKQKVKKSLTISALALLTVLELNRSSSALKSKFADIVMTHCDIGGLYNVRELRGLPYSLINDSGRPVRVEVTVEAPRTSETKENYEPVPDPTWIKVVPAAFNMEAGETILADVIISIPNDPKLLNRHFEAYIQAREIVKPQEGGTTALAFSVILRSRIRFSTGEGPATILDMKKRGLLTSLNFSFEPDSLYVPGFVEIGSSVNLSDDKGAFLSLVNRGHNNLKINILSVTPPEGVIPATGFEIAPDPSWLKAIEANPRDIKTKSVNDVNLVLTVPNDPKYKGRRYMFLLKSEIVGLDLPLETYSHVYVSIKE